MFVFLQFSVLWLKCRRQNKGFCTAENAVPQISLIPLLLIYFYFLLFLKLFFFLFLFFLLTLEYLQLMQFVSRITCIIQKGKKHVIFFPSVQQKIPVLISLQSALLKLSSQNLTVILVGHLRLTLRVSLPLLSVHKRGEY